MSIKTYRPITPARRGMTVSGFDGVEKHVKPEKSLVEVLIPAATATAASPSAIRAAATGRSTA